MKHEKHDSCQCEHSSHFDGKNHKYGLKVNTSPVKTEYGTFHVCKHCADTCYKQYKKNPRRRTIRKPIPEKRIKAKPRRKAVKRNPSKPHITARFSVRCDGKGIAFFKSQSAAFAYAKALHRVKPKATISVEK